SMSGIAASPEHHGGAVGGLGERVPEDAGREQAQDQHDEVDRGSRSKLSRGRGGVLRFVQQHRARHFEVVVRAHGGLYLPSAPQGRPWTGAPAERCPGAGAPRPAPYAAENAWTFPANPPSGGRPGANSRNSVLVTAKGGDRRASPRNADRSSPPVRFRTKAT